MGGRSSGAHIKAKGRYDCSGHRRIKTSGAYNPNGNTQKWQNVEAGWRSHHYATVGRYYWC